METAEDTGSEASPIEQQENGEAETPVTEVVRGDSSCHLLSSTDGANEATDQPPVTTGHGKGSWEAAIDPASGFWYYYNHATGQSQWEQPQA